MAVGELSTLGLGSQGILTNDIIDKLKNADKSSLITPIKTKQTIIQNKINEVGAIKKLMNSLSTSVTNMTYDTPYQEMKKDLTGSSISIDVNEKVDNQNFSLDVTKIATKDIFESSDGFTTKDSSLKSGDITIGIGDDSFKIDIKDGDTLEDLVKNINENTNGKVEASILNVGGDNPYKLIIKSTKTGEDNRLTITQNSDSFSNGIDRLGDEAHDAEFKFNGISVTRSSNEVDDLVNGVTIKLEKEGLTDVSLKNDNSKIVDGIKDFVEKYNTLSKVLTADTKYDSEKKQAGIFQGNSEIRSIMRSLNDIVSTTISKDSKVAGDFGLEIKRDGTLSFDEIKFQKAYDSDKTKTVEFFKASDATSGMFNKLESKLFDINTSSKGTIKSLKKSLEANSKRNEEAIKKAQIQLDSRYEILTRKFASADALMGRLNSSSDILTQMIDAQFAKNN